MKVTVLSKPDPYVLNAFRIQVGLKAVLAV